MVKIFICHKKMYDFSKNIGTILGAIIIKKYISYNQTVRNIFVSLITTNHARYQTSKASDHKLVNKYK